MGIRGKGVAGMGTEKSMENLCILRQKKGGGEQGEKGVNQVVAVSMNNDITSTHGSTTE